MKTIFNIQSLLILLALALLPVSCADVETETSGYASVKINLDDVSHRKSGRSKLAPNMTSSAANTILAVLIPAVQCDTSTVKSSIEYSRSLVDITNHDAQFVVPLDTKVKLCLYFFRDTFSLNDPVSYTHLTLPTKA